MRNRSKQSANFAICARVVGRMGGRIWVVSEPGRGSIFHFTAQFRLIGGALPEARETRGSAAGPDTAWPLPPMDERRWKPSWAFLRCHPHGRIQMPEMDGFEATAAIRAMERDVATRIPIIALTAHGLSGDRERCLSSGMDGYVTKPIQPAALYAAVEQPVPKMNTNQAPHLV